MRQHRFGSRLELAWFTEPRGWECIILDCRSCASWCFILKIIQWYGQSEKLAILSSYWMCLSNANLNYALQSILRWWSELRSPLQPQRFVAEQGE
jgi:hypothetical protein